jgi:glycosyltransferase involved in cell wall biosynthesis
MKLLHISDVYFPRINGVSTSIHGSMRELRRRGHQVDLIAPAYDNESVEEGITRVPAVEVPFDREDRLMRRSRALAAASSTDRSPIDLVHVHTPFVAQSAGRRAAGRFHAPLVTTFHTHFEDYLHCYVPVVPRKWLALAARAFSRRQARHADAVIAPSLAIRDVLERYGVRSRVEVIPTGIDTDAMRGGDGAAFRRRLGIEPQRKVLVNVSRMAHEKNIGFLIDVVAVVRRFVPDVLLLLAGEGPALPSLERRVLELGLGRNVRFVGYLDRESDLLDCYRAGDVFVFASRTETQGLVLLEAMSLEVPVVSTAVLGTRDVVGPRRGAVVVEEDVGTFAAQTLILLEDETLRRRLGREGRRYVEERWSERAAVSSLLELYGDLILRHCAQVATAPVEAEPARRADAVATRLRAKA